MPNLIVSKLIRRLERAELDHLRQVCAEQAARIEALEAELDGANRAAVWADQRADTFHDLLNNLAEQTDSTLGITPTGQMGLVAVNTTH